MRKLFILAAVLLSAGVIWPLQATDIGTRALIAQLEGHSSTAYYDSAGVLTICYGHTGPEVYEGLVLPDSACDNLLWLDISAAERAIGRLVTVDLSESQLTVLTSFVFNVGVGAFEESTLLRRLNTGDYEAVPQELLRWNKITVDGVKVPSRGLINRRNIEIQLWNGE